MSVKCYWSIEFNSQCAALTHVSSFDTLCDAHLILDGTWIAESNCICESTIIFAPLHTNAWY